MDGLQAHDENERRGSRLHREHCNPLTTRNDPAHRWARSGCVHVIGDRLVGLGQTRTHPHVGDARDEQAEDHDDTEGQNALGFLDTDGGDQKFADL
jgi:hypothetical protein